MNDGAVKKMRENSTSDYSFKPYDESNGYTPPLHEGTVNQRLLTAEQSGGSVSVVHGVIQPDGTALAHFHNRSSQLLYIIDGVCEVILGDDHISMAPGDTVLIPPGVCHKVKVTSDSPLKLVNVYYPALMEGDTISCKEVKE